MRAYVQSTDEDDEQESAGLMPAMDEGASLALDKCVSRESFTAAPQRYNEATLVKKMEELEIGRPSTYATIIETIQARDYVRRGNVPGKKRSYTTLTLKNAVGKEINFISSSGETSTKTYSASSSAKTLALLADDNFAMSDNLSSLVKDKNVETSYVAELVLNVKELSIKNNLVAYSSKK